MRAAHVTEIVTPKRYILNAIWYGIHRPHTVYIWIHGLTGSAFSGRHIIEQLAKDGAAGLTFGNRGTGFVNTAKRIRGNRTTYEVAGTAFEKFTDCVDDIQGAVNLARATGAKNVYLIGHSTGCQKAVYWASKGARGVKSIIMLGPLSDYAGSIAPRVKKRFAAGVSHARALVRRKRGYELMPAKYTESMFLTAQRFLSLYTPDSVEEIFTYSQLNKDPTTLKKVRIPIFVLLAEEDEYGDRPAQEIASWFEHTMQKGTHRIQVVPHATHSFKGTERDVAKRIRAWCRDIS